MCPLNIFAANPTFARIGSRISLDMLKSMRKVSVFFTLQNHAKPKKTKTQKTESPKTVKAKNPKP